MSSQSSYVSIDFPGAQVVDSLQIEQLPTASLSRLMVNLIQDGIGRSIQLPIIVARGKYPGPTFGLTAALHGNEINGIPVIHRFFETLDVQALRGTVVGVMVVNMPAFLNNERTFADRTDMNHIMPGKADGNISEIYAYRFIDRIARHFNYLIDLHTASFGNINSLYVRADMTHEVTAKMAYLQRPQIILHGRASDRTLRGAAMELGIAAITLEMGDPQVFQLKHIKPALIGVRRVMAEVKMLSKRTVSPGQPPVLCATSQWLYSDRGGLLTVVPKPTDLIFAGEVVAQQRNVFGEVVKEYHAPSDGIVIGKSVNPVTQTGGRILHWGSISAPGTPPFYDRSQW